MPSRQTHDAFLRALAVQLEVQQIMLHYVKHDK
jgi:hypothetical protein